jgi:transcriptional regulator with XRE-family HTH domain
MSRLNPQRSIGGEDNLARRIERERTAHGWSYEALAKRMTDAGCSIQGSAIYKIEKTDPPRRITVDELLALAQVFGKSVEDLLTPIEVLDDRRAQKLLEELDEADDELVAAIRKFLDAYSELLALAANNPELFEYVKGHHWREANTREELASSSLAAEDIVVKDDIFNFALYSAYGKAYLALLDSAGHYHRWKEQAARTRAEGGS